MKRRLWIALPLLLLAGSAIAAGISQWPALVAPLVDGDLLGITDVSDTSQSANGTSKRITMSQLATYMESGFYTEDEVDGLITAIVAGDIEITDAGDILTATTVEAALQEIKTAVDLNTLKETNTDSQTIDTLSLDGTVLSVSLEGDGEAPQTVDLAGIQDGTGTDDQTAAEVTTDTTNFDNNLSATDGTVQAALETLDELVGGGGDDLGSATASDVSALFSGTGDYLGSDGTKSTPTDNDTIADLSCSENQIAKWDGSEWACAADEEGAGGADADAIHDNVAGEIAAITLKASPVSNDLLLIEDSVDTNNKKRVTVSSIQDGTGTDDQTASEVSFTPEGSIAATNVQAAIQEVRDEDADSFSSYTVTTTVGDPGTDTNVPSEQGVREAIDAISIPTQSSLSVDDLITLSGVAEGSTSLGTFTGSTITDSQTIKAAMQELETAVEGAAGGHDAITLATDADTVLSLTDQEVGLDTQTANTVLAGPSSGAAADPTFRALVADDIPDISATYVGKSGNETIAGIKTFSSTPVFNDGISTGSSATGPGLITIVEDSDNGTNYVGVGSPASNNNDLIVLLPTSDPTAGQVPVFAVPASVTFADGVARDATQWSWGDLPTAASLSVDDLITLSGLAEGSTAIADPNGDVTATTIDGAITEIAAAVELNTAKTSNATHTGDVTGSTALTIASGAVADDELSDTLNLVTTGVIQGRVTVETDADGKALDLADATGTMQLATGAGTWVLPDVDDSNGTGWTVCVLSTTAAAVVIDPNAEDTITMDGTTDTAGDSITSASEAGNFACLMVTSISSNVANWTVLGRSGTWTAN